MSRHRNVRSMNFSDEYDGYDDVYGHSVEDDYCISPSDEAQFMYDRTRQPQMSAFFSEQDNIEEENCDAVDNKSKREDISRPKLNDLDEARLRSCLEEVRNVLGDDVSEQVLAETALKYDFDVNKCLDFILTNSPGSSVEVAKDAPKPQRIRRDRNADFVNFEDSGFSTTKELSHDELILEFQDSQLNSVEDKFCSVHLMDNGNTSKLISCQLGHSSSSGEFCSQFCNPKGTENTERFSFKKDVIRHGCEVETPSNIPISSLVFKNRESIKNDSCVLEGMLGVSDSVRTSQVFCQGQDPVVSTRSCTTDSETPHSVPVPLSGFDLSAAGDDSTLNKFSKNSLFFDVRDTLSHASNDSMIPIVYPSEKIATKMTSCKSTSELESEESLILDNLKLVESCILSQETLQPNTPSKMCKSSGEVACTCVFDKSLENSDNYDDNNKISHFSPLAALSNRHLKYKAATTDFSSIAKPFSKLVVSPRNDSKPKDDKCLVNALGTHIGVDLGERESNLPEKNIDFESLKCGYNANEDDSDDSDCSPLAALADKYLRVNDSSKLLPLFAKADSGYSTKSLPSALIEKEDTEFIDKLHMREFQNSELKSVVDDLSIHDECKYQKLNQKNNRGEFSGDVYSGEVSICVGNSSDLPLGGCASDGAESSSKQEHKLCCEQPALSLSDLAFHHLTRSASCGVRSDQGISQKKFHSDTGISRSVPSGFVIPFLLKSEDDSSCSKSKNSNCNEGESELDTKESAESDQSMDSSDDWVIDLSNALRKPELRLTYSAAENRLPATVIHVENAELQEETEEITPCHLDASGILKMKFSYSQRRCSPFGHVLCRAWGRLPAPYIPRRKRMLDTVARFTFDKPSPDDITLVHLNRKS